MPNHRQQEVQAVNFKEVYSAIAMAGQMGFHGRALR